MKVRISTELKEIVISENKLIDGKLVLSCERPVVSREFIFFFDTKRQIVSLVKDEKEFVKLRGIITQESLRSYSPEQRYVLNCFCEVFRLYIKGVNGQESPEDFDATIIGDSKGLLRAGHSLVNSFKTFLEVCK